MNKFLKIIAWIIVLMILVLLFLFLLKQKQPISQACINETCFQVEVAQTQEEMKKGLMFREYLDKNKGMLFVFEIKGNYPFWMKNTLILLDIIWINENNQIVFIKENAEPCKEEDCLIIDPNQNAKYVLEIKGGLSKEMNIKIGDKIEFRK